MTDGSDDGSQQPPPRRDFLNVAIAGTATALGVSAGYPVLRFLQPSSRHSVSIAEAGPAADFPNGTSKAVLLGERAAIVIRLANGEFRAFIALCTHLQCVVAFAPERNRIECRCHKGVYSVDGENISGPPPRPLTPLKVAIVEGVVVVSEA